jgi:hypothetical protein
MASDQLGDLEALGHMGNASKEASCVCADRAGRLLLAYYCFCHNFDSACLVLQTFKLHMTGIVPLSNMRRKKSSWLTVVRRVGGSTAFASLWMENSLYSFLNKFHYMEISNWRAKTTRSGLKLPLLQLKWGKLISSFNFFYSDICHKAILDWTLIPPLNWTVTKKNDQEVYGKVFFGLENV